jgi:hypothetical protein
MNNKEKVNRRRFLKTSGAGALGMACFSMGNLKAQDRKEDKTAKHCRWWLDTLMNQIEKCDIKRDCSELVEMVGRECARNHVIRKAKEIKNKAGTKNITGIIKAINQELFKSELFKYQENFISAQWHKCYCPTRSAGYVSSPVFCHCSVGWVKELFETLLSKKVKASLIKSIAKGDACCKIKVYI